MTRKKVSEKIPAANNSLKMEYGPYQWRKDVLTSVYSLLKQLTYAGMFWMFCHYGYLTIGELAGKNTTISFLSKMYVTVSASLTIGSLAYALYSHQSKKNTVSHMGDKIISLEKMIDPNRSSSQLSPDGSSNPDDL